MHEMAEKILKLENKVKQNESKSVSKALQASNKLRLFKRSTIIRINKTITKKKKPKERVHVFLFFSELKLGKLSQLKLNPR